MVAMVKIKGFNVMEYETAKQIRDLSFVVNGGLNDILLLLEQAGVDDFDEARMVMGKMVASLYFDINRKYISNIFPDLDLTKGPD